MKKKPVSDEIQSMLRESHLGTSYILPPEAPITQMMLSIDCIKLYDRNPRREPNPRYAEIKASICAQGGLNNPLTITRRLGDELYMVESGGNTRLQILRELHAETGDERFFRIHCLFRPWISESHILSAHLIENELRGELMLIDKALALSELKAGMEQEAGKRFSRSMFVRQLGRLGYPTSRRHIIRFEYAATSLYPLIPVALRSGLGPRDIDCIRKYETAYRTFWENRAGTGERESFDETFRASLAANDGSDFDLDVLRQDLERRIASELNTSIQLLRFEVDASKHERDYSGDPPEEGVQDLPNQVPEASTVFAFPSNEPNPSPPSRAADPVVTDHSPGSRDTYPTHNETGLDHLTVPDEAVGVPGAYHLSASCPPFVKGGLGGIFRAARLIEGGEIPLNPPFPKGEAVLAAMLEKVMGGEVPGERAKKSSSDRSSLERSAESAFLPTDLECDLKSALSIPCGGSTDISSLRSHNYILALQIAQRNDLEPCISSAPHLGMGFLVDLPMAPFDALKVEDFNRRWIWWLLVSLSEELIQPERLERINGHHQLRDLFLNEQADVEECLHIFGEPDWPSLGYQFLNDPALDEQDFRDLILLAIYCRRLRKLANDDGELALWTGE